jgi:hypothetical protein
LSPRLKPFASLWTLLHYPHGSSQQEWSLEQKFSAIREAGFEGFQGDAQPEFKELAEAHGLAFLGGCQADAENYSEILRAFAPLRPIRLNVQLGNHLISPEEAVRLWIKMEGQARDLGLELDLETHRDTCTETPEKTWRIAELYEQQTGALVRLNFDFSHFAVVKHLYPPYAGRLLERPDLLRFSRQIHLRPFNGHHAEIPFTDAVGNITGWAKDWLEFAEAALSCWKEGQSSETTLWACPELGAMTSGYWLPSFSDPWQDARAIQTALADIWNQLGAPSE